MHKEYKVSAIITTYKRDWDIVMCAIESIKRQTVPVYEIILVDDNDANSMLSKEIRNFLKKDYPSVKYVSMGMNSGVSAARNRGILESSGDIIGFLDDDDEWKKNKLEIMLPLFEKEENVGLVFGTGRVVDTFSGREYYNWQWEVFKERPTYEIMLENDYIGSTSSPLIKKQVLDDVGMFRTKNQPAVEDYELWIRIAHKYNIIGTRDVVFLKHTDNMEHVSGSMNRLFQGFKNIYLINKPDYDKNLHASVGILWNISRVGVRGKNIRVIPYVFKWANAKKREKKCKKQEKS